ncbi:MAG: hypothetical protein E8D47_13115 [Nitrospira sp.]|nr:MAG: hypothetical protein E8D47_13115 [Nitrospira sp.]
MNKHNWFRAESPVERSGDILVSFDPQWRDLLRDSSIGFVVRRRYPKVFLPRRMFVYICAPYSELIGFCSIKKLRRINLREGLQILGQSGLTREDLEAYFLGYEEIGCYSISHISLFRTPLSLESLRNQAGFSPPQSFVSLSRRASGWLDQIHSNKALHGGFNAQRNLT